MKHKKRMIAVLGVLTILIAGVAQVTAATTDNISFKFQIKANQGNTFSSSRERSTSNPNCAWMVDFRNSTESKTGAKCVTRFWLEKDLAIGIDYQVSDDADVKEGSGRHFYKSTKNGVKCNVQLGAENNNYTATTYEAIGYWDEETAKTLK